VGRLFPRTRRGTFRVLLADDHRAVVAQLAESIASIIEHGDADGDVALRRLFPPAYSDDPEKNAEYDGLMRGDLRDGRLAALAVVRESSNAEELTEEQLLSWLGALNDIRLYLGTRLGVTEDMAEPEPGDPDAAMLDVYRFLSLVQEEVVDALGS